MVDVFVFMDILLFDLCSQVGFSIFKFIVHKKKDKI